MAKFPSWHARTVRRSKRHGTDGDTNGQGSSRKAKNTDRVAYRNMVKTNTKISVKCHQRLANDVGYCDKVKGHKGEHSNAWYRKNRDV